jgi:hypothetical protein
MIFGDPGIFAVESGITEAYARPGLSALGFFVIYIQGNRYGVYQSDATLLGNSFDQVQTRISRRGLHIAPYATEFGAGRIADAFRGAIYADDPHEDYLGLPRNEFRDLAYSGDLLWGPDGDEALDDGSYVLQFDVGDRVRLIAFKCRQNGLHDPPTLREAWISAEEYYQVLCNWREAVQTEWEALPNKEI